MITIPIISGFTPATCISKGGSVTIQGKHFGNQSGKGVALGGHGIHVDAQILSWSDASITVRIPNDPKIQLNQWYYLGIEQANHGKWLSNINKNITICASAPLAAPKLTLPMPGTPSGPAIVLPPAGSGASAQPPPESTPAPEYGGEWPGESGYPGDSGYYGDSGGLPQPSYGSLLSSPLPPVPQVPPVAPEAEKSDIEPAEVVIIHSSPDEARQFAETARGMGLSIKRRRTLKGLGLVVSVVRLPVGMTVSDALLQLRGQLPDLWADANHRFTLQADADPKSYALRMMGWDGQGVSCNTPIRIGMIDTTVTNQHPVLQGAQITQKSFLPSGIEPAPPRHGTAVAALLVAQGEHEAMAGLVPAAQLFVAGVFRGRDDALDTSAERIAYALDWLLEQRVSTINLSLGGPRNLLVEAALHRVMQTGVVAVAAAGNGGAKGAPVYPAAQQGVIAVTAIDADARLYRNATHGDYVVFSAPGVDVWSADARGGGAYFSGTSYATPFVTAALATRITRMAPAAVIEAQKKSVIDLGTPGRDPEYGWGLIQSAGRCPSSS